uniref:Uncharacterized protein n=1 Tax=Dulem virus 42 TaxID=3145760 RepID=A0AAU8B7T2_9CAUD
MRLTSTKNPIGHVYLLLGLLFLTQLNATQISHLRTYYISE